ncbi:MAG: glycosyl transferase [Patescibacteria group bacterium]|nr:MAG: glycosyl transferase [Patescibacteria group bacterium]
MKNNNLVYCTYFDKGFLIKGLALHASLIKNNPKAKLWILAFDSYTKDILNKMKLKGVTVVSLSSFEDKELLSIKNTRQTVEYYWTCTPSWILYVLEKTKADYVIYLDADLYFFSNPDPAVLEIGNKSLLVVEHRFPSGRKGMEIKAGRFNVAFNVFKNDRIGKKCLERWRKQCIDWCYWKPEGNKLGDQKYLDEWPMLYEDKLVISENLGVDAAPWNISQYRISSKDGDIYINDDKLVCYHFHQLRILGPNHYSRVLGYTLPKAVVDLIYIPYEKELDKQYSRIKSYDSEFELVATKQSASMLLWHKLARYLGPIYWKLKSISR